MWKIFSGENEKNICNGFRQLSSGTVTQDVK